MSNEILHHKSDRSYKLKQALKNFSSYFNNCFKLFLFWNEQSTKEIADIGKVRLANEESCLFTGMKYTSPSITTKMELAIKMLFARVWSC